MTQGTFVFRECNADVFAETAADLLSVWIAQATQERGRCTLALSGGSTPRPVYRDLAQKNIDWKKLGVCLVDERYVAPTDKDSNSLLVRETLPQAQLTVPDTSLSVPACVDDYEKKILSMLPGGSLDIAVLGMGEDGHIASLFPPVTDEGLSRTGIVHTTTDRFAVRDRIGMTLPLLKRAKRRLLLLNGDGKKRVWETMLASARDPKRWPLQELSDDALTVLYAA